MTTISAKVICDSIGEHAPRLTTLHLRYPRFIHAEFMTHRVFSRNARSSRAVPIAKLIEEVQNDPVIPLHWGAAQAGMQAYAECEKTVRLTLLKMDERRHLLCTRQEAWLEARDHAVRVARAFMEAGYAKQVVNRLLEPFLHIDTLVTASEWANFFALRDHDAAEPHIRMLAKAIKQAMATSAPAHLKNNEWHLPYVTAADFIKLADEDAGAGKLDDAARMISAARCARISYHPFDAGDASVTADFLLAEKLSTSRHWSPFEHQASPDSTILKAVCSDTVCANSRLHGNLTGWKQSRKLFEGEAGPR